MLGESTTSSCSTYLPSESYSPIVYPVAIVGSSERKRGAETFLEYLLSGEAGAIFRSYGFDHLGR